MLQYGDRRINVKKIDLIDIIRINKENHIKEYEKALVVYKEEALRQLSNLIKEAEDGSNKIELDLTHPVDNSKNYDKIIEIFTWEVNDIVELTQREFKELVLDDADFSSGARSANMFYMN